MPQLSLAFVSSFNPELLVFIYILQNIYQVPAADIENHKKSFDPALSATLPHEKIAVLSNSSRNHPQLDKAFWKVYCKNCFWLNKWEKHSLTQCKSLGNECKVTCPTCNRNGKKGAYHWAEECPHKKK